MRIIKDSRKLQAMTIAIIVREHLEDLHDGKNPEISQSLMKKINIRVRQGIYEYLAILDKATQGNSKAVEIMNTLPIEIPEYWEEPKDITYLEGEK